MADSPSHTFGQFLGNLLEALILPELEGFCKKHSLYLDRHGVRPGVRKGKKATWIDDYGNSHDLDFVIEKDGTTKSQGRPLFRLMKRRQMGRSSKSSTKSAKAASL